MMLELYCCCNTTANLMCPFYIHPQRVLEAEIKKRSFQVSQLWKRWLQTWARKSQHFGTPKLHFAVDFKRKVAPRKKRKRQRSLLLLHAALLFSFVFTEPWSIFTVTVPNFPSAVCSAGHERRSGRGKTALHLLRLIKPPAPPAPERCHRGNKNVVFRLDWSKKG